MRDWTREVPKRRAAVPQTSLWPPTSPAPQRRPWKMRWNFSTVKRYRYNLFYHPSLKWSSGTGRTRVHPIGKFDTVKFSPVLQRWPWKERCNFHPLERKPCKAPLQPRDQKPCNWKPWLCTTACFGIICWYQVKTWKLSLKHCKGRVVKIG